MTTLIKVIFLAVFACLATSTMAKNYYVQTTTKLNWYAAFEYCKSQGYQLATINSQAEQNDINAAIKASSQPTQWMWTSGTNSAGLWAWMSTGAPFTYTNWALGMPDNFGGNEHCLNLWPDLIKQYVLNDYPCSNALYFVCEDCK